LSGDESATASEVLEFLAPTRPDRLVTGLGGHGVVLIYEGESPGPTLMFRAELDALPIEETSPLPYRSQSPGKAHSCGHDGHMATLGALARGLGRRRPERGRAVLLFQPAEETGAGAAAILADPRFREISPDFAFAYHNRPGLPLGQIALRAGPVNCASRGLRIRIFGKTAHASTPEFGTSPMAAVAKLMPELTALGNARSFDDEFALVTITHARLGAPAFGISPGDAEIWATLRTLKNSRMAGLCDRAETAVSRAAASAGLRVEISYEDIFEACENDPRAVALLQRALEAEGLEVDERTPAMRASEDFGRFGASAPATMFFLGAGEAHASLHNSDYDFPDDLIEIGARIFMRALRDCLG
jgi:amidohydrolase